VFLEANPNPRQGEIRIPKRLELGKMQLQLSDDSRHLYGQVTLTNRVSGQQRASKLDFTRDN
jgi:hypothetical protein